MAVCTYKKNAVRGCAAQTFDSKQSKVFVNKYYIDLSSLCQSIFVKFLQHFTKNRYL